MKVAIIGSFRKNYAQILRALEEFNDAGATVIFPKRSSIVKPDLEFVRLKTDSPNLQDDQVESLALKKILAADLIYVVAPEGYIGKTVSYELGRAFAINRPVYFSDATVDLPINVLKTAIGSPKTIIKNFSMPTLHREKSGLGHYQDWVRRVVIERGFDKEQIHEVFAIFVEEVGEMAKAIRKYSGLATDKKSKVHKLDHEAADVFFMLLDLCNRLGIDLETAFIEKEKKNKNRKWS